VLFFISRKLFVELTVGDFEQLLNANFNCCVNLQTGEFPSTIFFDCHTPDPFHFPNLLEVLMILDSDPSIISYIKNRVEAGFSHRAQVAIVDANNDWDN